MTLALPRATRTDTLLPKTSRFLSDERHRGGIAGIRDRIGRCAVERRVGIGKGAAKGQSLDRDQADLRLDALDPAVVDILHQRDRHRSRQEYRKSTRLTSSH